MWELTEIEFPVNEVKSNMVRKNAVTISRNGIDYYVIYACKDADAKGWFRKDNEATKSLGRYLCDLMQKEIGNDGFFTTDEIKYKRDEPSLYGLTKSQIETIIEKTSANPDHDLVFIFAYNKKMAIAASQWLEKTLDKYNVTALRKLWGPLAWNLN